MINRHCIYFVGCPLFGVTVELAPRGEHTMWPNPSPNTFMDTCKGPRGERHVWFGQRVSVILEPRRLRPASPLLVIE